MSSPNQQKPDMKSGQEKSKDEIKAERKAKQEAQKQAKQKAKEKKANNAPKDENQASKPPETSKEIPKEVAEKPDMEKSKCEIKAERKAKQEAQKAAKQKAKEKKEQGENTNVPSTPAQIATQEVTPSKPEGKSKAELKAERRAKQEAQRAAKELAKQQQDQAALKDAQKVHSDASKNANKKDDKNAEIKLSKAKGKETSVSKNAPSPKKVTLFSHLPQYNGVAPTANLPLANGPIHPGVLRVGLMMSEGVLTGANSSCLGLMHALKKFIGDHVAPTEQEWLRHLNDAMDEQVAFLARCRSISVAMNNAVRFVKNKLQALDIKQGDDCNRQVLLEAIDTFVEENVMLANKQIAMTARDKIRNGDVILTFACCPLVESVLKEAKRQNLDFRVIVADGRPKNEGRELCRRLIKAQIECTYTTLTALPYSLNEVTKVLLGAEAVFANGSVMARVGTAQVSLLAKAFNIPVLVCCETYKFSERAQTDSFVYNELGDPEELARTAPSSPLSSWRTQGKLSVLNLSFDVTPASLVDAIVSELCVIPTTSVPVVLRMKNAF